MKYPKFYSIPHLPNSKLGTKDKTCEPNQAHIATKLLNAGYTVIVQEKLDGATAQINRVGSEIITTIKDGYTCNSAPKEWAHFHLFDKWVQSKKSLFLANLKDGQRIAGEWLLQTHGIKYDLNSIDFAPFIAFDFFDNAVRYTYQNFLEATKFLGNHHQANLLHFGQAISVDAAKTILSLKPLFKSIESSEGLIYRVEKSGKLLFILKWVNSDFVAGKYLPIVTNSQPVYNMNLEHFNSILAND